MTYLYTSPGLIVAFALFIVFAVAYGVIVPRLRRYWLSKKAEPHYYGEAGFTYGVVTIVGGILLLVYLLTVVLTNLPFNPYYWNVYEKQGTLSSVSNQFAEGTGDSTYRSYTYLFEGDDTRYVLSDPRAASFKKGDALTLKCVPHWHLEAADTVDCTIRSY